MSNCEQANHLQPHQQQELIRLMAQHFSNQLQPPSDQQMPLDNFQSALVHYQRQQQYQRLCQDAINFSAQNRTATSLSQPAQTFLGGQQQQQQQVAGQLANMNALGLLNPLMATAAGPQHIFNALNCFGLTQTAESNQALALNFLQQQYLLQMASVASGGQPNVMNEMTPNQGGAREPALKFSISTILGRNSPSTPPSENQAHSRMHNVAASSKFIENNHKSAQRDINNTGTISPRPSINNAGGKRHGRELRPNFEKARHEETTRKNSNNHQQQHRQPLVSPSSAKTNSNELDVGGTALSSLTNFVSNSLAPIFGESDPNSSVKTRRSPSALANNQRPSLSTNRKGAPGQYFDLNGSNEFSGNESSHEDDRSSLASSVRISKSNGTSKQTSSSSSGIVSGSLKSSPGAAAPTVANTISTTLAKAPLELVQKQPAWVFCTRYSDRPSSGPRTRRAKSRDKKPKDTKFSAEEKRPRTAFTSEQLEKLREEFQANSYLDEKRRKSLAERLNLNENQIKIWFQNKRAKMKKQSNQPNPLRGLLVAGGLYNHSTATSDCSESYANGLADDIGNRIMRDVELENDDDHDDHEDHEDHEGGRNQVGAAEMENADRLLLKRRQQQLQVANRSCGSLASATASNDDQDNNNNNKGNTQEQATGDSKTLKRDHISNQSDGDDEDDDNMAHSNSSPSRAVIKRVKLNQHHHNHHHQADRLAISHANLSRLIDCGGLGEQSAAMARVATSAPVDDDEEPVISVS